ncbi:long-chain fatty acid transporter [Algoriphagus kandeliae]|uniref:Long-chain fatty acid transporter n=1 Tax=Algoriphagus kandeliae TaxID=2562278 RepID=A0A4Y9QLC6_9BACT|nr:long-chain fatty acid transporter [Algoriphagus kandeliae]TFV92382.1 long-chain fatty acid transporter [Algoriphagus kandeliae]
MRYLLAWFFLLIGNFAFSQSGYFEDALRFSRNIPAGSARVMAIGGTQWSLGGDVSNIAGNPAGLGFFRKSEASISLGYSDWGIQTQFLGQNRNYNTTNFSVPNLSVVFANPKGILNRGAFKGGSWGISIQRIANFNSEFGYFSDIIGESSILDFYIQDSFGVPESQIESFGITGLAYQTYLINPITVDENGNTIINPDTYDSFVLGFPFQDENVYQEGSSNQITFSYGANFQHKLFVGGSLGIRSLSYFSQKEYNEEFIDEPLFTSSLRENLFINGTGVNLNIGIIYKPIDYVNLGFNFQTPTWYALSEEYDSNITAEYNNYYYEPEDITLGTQQAYSDLFVNNFQLNSPLRIGGGGTVFLGKNGFISADIDWVDYSAARINSNNFNEGPDNEAIQSLYTSTINYRFGAEGRINMFYIRAGYAYYGDPFVSNSIDRSTTQLSGGVGVRVKNFNIDFALVNQKFNSVYQSYQYLDSQNNNIGPVTDIKNNIFNGVLTLGLSF